MDGASKSPENKENAVRKLNIEKPFEFKIL